MRSGVTRDGIAQPAGQLGFGLGKRAESLYQNHGLDLLRCRNGYEAGNRSAKRMTHNQTRLPSETFCGLQHCRHVIQQVIAHAGWSMLGMTVAGKIQGEKLKPCKMGGERRKTRRVVQPAVQGKNR